MLPIRFCLNPVSFTPSGAFIPDGQVGRMISPILPHLADVEFSVGLQPIENAVNVYYTHRDAYRRVRREVGVFVSHGIADKGWRNHTGRFYRATFVSGPAWSLHLLDFQTAPHVIFEVGYPKLDPLHEARAQRPVNDRPVVVWAPTHGGGGDRYASVAPLPENAPDSPHALKSSWWHRDEILGLLRGGGFDVIEAPHPRHRADRGATFDEYARADVVVADGGSTIYEAWALGIPVVFPTWLTGIGNTTGTAIGTMEASIYSTRTGRHADAPEQLVDLVRDAAVEGITIGEHDFVEPILPAAYRGEGGRMHAETLLDLAAGIEPPRHTARFDWEEFQFAGRTQRVAVGTRAHTTYTASRSWHRVVAKRGQRTGRR